MILWHSLFDSLIYAVIFYAQLVVYNFVCTNFIYNFNPFAAGYMLVYSWILKTLISMYYRGNISSMLSSNSGASASEIIDNKEECFPWYYWVRNTFQGLIYHDISLLLKGVKCFQQIGDARVTILYVSLNG